MDKLLVSDNRTAFDVVSIIAGLGLLLSPWYLGFSAEASAAMNAWVAGGAIVMIAAAALFAFHEAEAWMNLALGLWALVAPWALGFSAVTAAAWVHAIAGIVVAAAAGAVLWLVRNRPLSAA